VKVGYYAPLPPQPTGVADYAARLLGLLRRRGEVEVNARRADVFLYHLGNNELHREIYREALRRPGVVILHDAVLHHFFLGALERAAYLEEFVYNYGEWARDLAAELWAGRSRSAQDPRYFRYPMLRRIAEVSRAVVVHNPAAARMAREHCPAARVVEIPFPVWLPERPPEAEILRWRRAAGIEPRTLLLGVFGHLRESKRLAAVLRAFQQARQAGARAALLLGGRFGSAELERALAPLMAGVLRAGYLLEERSFWKLAAAADVCVNLRYPAAGETSGLGLTMMGMGKAVVFSAGEEIARLPEDVCLRVAPGLGERAELAAYIGWLAGRPEAAREMGRRAAAYVCRRHAPEAAAERYWEILTSA
jgi:glycosyltransferase involved in cell wall biosynthesis